MIVDEPPPNAGNVISIVDRRKRIDAEAEVERLKAENDALVARLNESAQLTVAGRVTKHSSEQCRYHLRVVVDEFSPTVICADCETELDAHAVLLEFAKRERTFRHWVESYITEKVALEKKIEALKAQKNKLAREVRQLGGKPEAG